MSRYVRPASFVLFLAIGAVLIYGAYATPLPAATPPPTHNIPIWQTVEVTRQVVVTATATPTEVPIPPTSTPPAYIWPTPTNDASCYYRVTNGCDWTTPVPAPTNAPLEGDP